MPPDELQPGDAERPQLAGAGLAFPARLRLLCVAAREPVWINLTLQLDAAGCHEPQFVWISTSGEALALLREESFDCVLVAATADADAELGLVRAIRASGCADAVVILSPGLADERLAAIYELGGEVLMTARPWDSVALLPTIRRAISGAELLRENHRLATAHYRRLVRERDEAEQLLQQQRQMISELEAVPRIGNSETPTDSAPSEPCPLPPRIIDYYHELLRTYVIIGSGSLSADIAHFAEILATAGLSPREVLQLHLERVEALVRGLGSRSSRHVMTRADLLALELMIHVGECYQKQARGGKIPV